MCMVGLILTNKYSYQEWLRDWSDEARQPAMQGANSSKMILILGDKVLTAFLSGMAFF
jgi:hypothetical protein